MIKGVEKKAIPYVLEDDRMNSVDEQTIFWINPKTGHDSNRTLQRYAGASKDGRKGYRELNVGKLDSADIEEFLSVCTKVEKYVFSSDNQFHADGKVYDVIEDPVMLTEVARTLSSDYLSEVFEVSNNINRLKEGQKKGFSF